MNLIERYFSHITIDIIIYLSMSYFINIRGIITLYATNSIMSHKAENV